MTPNVLFGTGCLWIHPIVNLTVFFNYAQLVVIFPTTICNKVFYFHINDDAGNSHYILRRS